MKCFPIILLLLSIFNSNFGYALGPKKASTEEPVARTTYFMKLEKFKENFEVGFKSSELKNGRSLFVEFEVENLESVSSEMQSGVIPIIREYIWNQDTNQLIGYPYGGMVGAS